MLRSPIAGGGSETYCLKTFHGEPGPRATVRDAGTLAIELPGGTIAASVSIVQRFAADGIHARQTLRGTVTGGTGTYRGAHGTISGGGTDVENPPGTITAASLRYTIRLS